MRKFGFLLLLLGLSACSLTDLNAPKTTSESTVESSVLGAQTQTLRIGAETYQVEMARTKEERELGLMHRESMPADHGMLFVFEAPRQLNFWMKNTLIPLDMIWIDTEGTIVDIRAAEPCTTPECTVYSGKAPALYVLELNQGVTNAQVGDKVEW